MSELVTLGEAMLVLRGTEPGRLRVGSPFTASMAGAEANVAIGVARLGHRATWIGRVGRDGPGELIRETLAGAGVDVSAVVVDGTAATGLLLRSPRTTSLTTVSYHRTGSAGSRLEAADLGPYPGPGTRIVHLTGITPALGAAPRDAVFAAADRAARLGVEVSFDVNHRTRLTTAAAAGETLRRLLPRIQILFCGTDEVDVLAAATGSTDPVPAALAAGVREVVLKDGAAGAAVHTREGRGHAPAVPVASVADVVGAGDAFVAGYLSARLDGLDVAERLRRATTVAAFSVGSAGDWEGLPLRAELDLLAGQPGGTLR